MHQETNIFATCDANDPLGQALGLTETEIVEVADPQLCELALPSDLVLKVCPEDTNNAGALVTDERLCEAPNDDKLCLTNTDLAGVYVNNPSEDCDIVIPDQPIVTNPEVQCLKCADLTANSHFNQALEISRALIGSPNGNVFTVYDAEGDEGDERNLIEDEDLFLQDIIVEERIIVPFEECLANAAANPGTGTSAVQAHALSLQEDSLTTNVKPQAEISTFSAPTIAQGTEEDLYALEKTTKLKQQWLNLLP